MNSKKKVLFAYVTFPSETVAEQICEVLVNDSVVACANIFAPMRSIYKWQGRVQKEQEWAAILKTTELKKAALEERIRAIHPYATPCLVYLPSAGGSPEFLRWVYSQSL